MPVVPSTSPVSPVASIVVAFDGSTNAIAGRPRTVLGGFAATGDMVVIGARGQGAIGSAMLGSVSTWLLHHAVGPMVVVPQPPDEGVNGDDDADVDDDDASGPED